MKKTAGRIPKRIAFQGELGAFSQQAIQQLLGRRAEPIPYQRFDQAFAALKTRQVDAAVVPIENSLAGSVYENYDLLMKFPFEITAETSVRVVHNLIAPPEPTTRCHGNPGTCCRIRTTCRAAPAQPAALAKAP